MTDVVLKVGFLLTDNGREYCDRLNSHLYEIYLGAQGIGIERQRQQVPGRMALWKGFTGQ